jgi:hypothetical protein
MECSLPPHRLSGEDSPIFSRKQLRNTAAQSRLRRAGRVPRDTVKRTNSVIPVREVTDRERSGARPPVERVGYRFDAGRSGNGNKRGRLRHRATGGAKEGGPRVPQNAVARSGDQEGAESMANSNSSRRGAPGGEGRFGVAAQAGPEQGVQQVALDPGAVRFGIGDEDVVAGFGVLAHWHSPWRRASWRPGGSTGRRCSILNDGVRFILQKRRAGPGDKDVGHEAAPVARR